MGLTETIITLRTQRPYGFYIPGEIFVVHVRSSCELNHNLKKYFIEMDKRDFFIAGLVHVDYP
jgi:hypothetical protein